MIISIIAAVSENGVIGKNNQLPWHLPDDMKFFMQTTKGHYVIMGRKNFESIPEKFRPLPNRFNIVVTHRKDYIANGCKVVHSMEAALAICQQANQQEIFIIGGSEIYQQSMSRANQLYLTEIHSVIEGDTYFPHFEKNAWSEVSRKHHGIDERHKFAFDFVLYRKIVI